MEVGQGHFGGRDQIEIPRAGNLEQVGFELGQLAGAGERGGVGEKGGLHLPVAVLARVQVEHEVDQRARQPRAGAAQHGKPRAGDPRTALEIENAQCRTEVPVRLRREVERPRLALPPDLEVVSGGAAVRHRRMREVRQRQDGGGALVFDAVLLHAELLDLRRARLVRFENLRRVFALPFGLRDGIASRVLLPLQPFQLGNHPAPRRLEGDDVLELLIQLAGLGAAPPQPGAHLIDVIADVGRVEHDISAF